MATSASLEAEQISIKPAQVRVGLHVRIPLSWFSHGFRRASFLVTTEAEVKQIVELGVDVFYDPKKSKVKPRSLEPVSDPVLLAAAALREAERAVVVAQEQAKDSAVQERAAVMAAMRARLDSVQKSYAASMQQTASAFASMGGKPAEGVAAMGRVAEASMKALLTDVEATLMLTHDKIGVHGDVAHAMSVMTLSLLLARQLEEPESTVLAIGTGALLHDVGAIWLDRSIARNASRSKVQETVFRTHCRLGVESLRNVATSLAPEVLDVILNHHERVDGSGYPSARQGDALSRAARIVGIADRFDELTNPLDAGGGLSPYEALATMWSKERAGFDEEMMQHFIRAMGVYPPGTLVQLSDERIAVVVSAAPASARMSPQVLVYEPSTPRRQALIIDLALPASNVDGVQVSKALRVSDRSKDELDYLMPRRNVSWFCGS